MDEDIVFTYQLRQFLKKILAQSQREIEQSVYTAKNAKRLDGTEVLKASLNLQIKGIDFDLIIDEETQLSKLSSG
mgnify:CR=1 FL=1